MSEVERKIKEDIAGALRVLSDPYIVIKDDGAVFTEKGDLLIVTEQGRYVVRLEPFDKKKEEPGYAVVRIMWPPDAVCEGDLKGFAAIELSDEMIELLSARMNMFIGLQQGEPEVCSLEFWDDNIKFISFANAPDDWKAEQWSEGDCLIEDNIPEGATESASELVTMVISTEGICWSACLDNLWVRTTFFDPRPFP